MSKFGVGVGDAFPLDDSAAKAAAAGKPNTPEDDRAEFEDWKRRREAYRAQREAGRAQRDEWKRHRREWRDRWRAERRAFRDELRYGGSSAAHADPWHPYAMGHGPWRIVAIVAAICVIVFAVAHIGYVIVGLAALAILFAAYHHHAYDPFDIGPRDYARPTATPTPKPADTPQDPAAS